MLSHHAALVHVMTLVAAADAEMSDAELHTIGDMVNLLPVFGGYTTEDASRTAEVCVETLEQEEGLEKVIEQVRQSVPEGLRETAYVLGCDVAEADGAPRDEEWRLLAMLREALAIDPLIAAALQRGARARHATIDR